MGFMEGSADVEVLTEKKMRKFFFITILLMALFDEKNLPIIFQSLVNHPHKDDSNHGSDNTISIAGLPTVEKYGFFETKME